MGCQWAEYGPLAETEGLDWHKEPYHERMELNSRVTRGDSVQKGSSDRIIESDLNPDQYV